MPTTGTVMAESRAATVANGVTTWSLIFAFPYAAVITVPGTLVVYGTDTPQMVDGIRAGRNRVVVQVRDTAVLGCHAVVTQCAARGGSRPVTLGLSHGPVR